MRILHFDIADSTQNIAASLIDNEVENILILADTQTQGRGRLNERSWQSPKGNFYGSFIVNLSTLGFLENSVSSLNSLSLNIIKNFIEIESGQSPIIKPPNDILVNGLKIAGVLIEIQFPIGIIGIGLNTKISPLPTSIKLDLDNNKFADFFYNQLYLRS